MYKERQYNYWGVLTAIYLTWSFLTNHWHISWLVFAIGGVLFPIVMMLCNLIADKNKKGYFIEKHIENLSKRLDLFIKMCYNNLC